MRMVCIFSESVFSSTDSMVAFRNDVWCAGDESAEPSLACELAKNVRRCIVFLFLKAFSENARPIYDLHEGRHRPVVLPQHEGVLRAARKRPDPQCFDASEYRESESSLD